MRLFLLRLLWPPLFSTRKTLVTPHWSTISLCNQHSFLHFRCFINCLPKISPSVRLSVSSECQGLQCFQISSYEWILYQRYEGNASTAWQRKHNLELITSTPLNASNIVINGGSLAAGNKYRLALFITTTDGLRAMSAYDISTALPPTRGTCSITPSSGISLESYFTLSCVNWTSDSTPLSYRFQYRLKNGMYTVLYHGVNNSIATLGIPPGNNAENYNIRLNVVVTDNFGISASPVNLTAQVSLVGRYSNIDAGGKFCWHNFVFFLTAAHRRLKGKFF